MKMPMAHSKRKKVKKVCEHCGEPYKGFAISKFCYVCRENRVHIWRSNQGNRKRLNGYRANKKRNISRKELTNGMTKRQLLTPRIMTLGCRLLGCNNAYEICYSRGTTAYPKYCPEHRSEYKRERFLNVG